MLKRYEEAVSKPYGHLMVDFKPGTAEHQRLKTNVLPDDNPYENKKRQMTPQVGLHEIQKIIRTSPPESDEDDDDDPFANMPSCEDCGLVFGTHYDLQKHVKLWCVGAIDEPPTKKVKVDIGESGPLDIAKNKTFRYLHYKAKDHNKTQWGNKFGKYVDKDQMDEARATRKADEKIKPEDKREFFRRYIQLLKMIKHLHTCDVHKRIVDDMMVLHSKGDKKASSNVLLPYKHLFEGLFDQDNSDEESDASAEDQEEDVSDEDQEEDVSDEESARRV
jgi:hypothetical protein